MFFDEKHHSENISQFTISIKDEVVKLRPEIFHAPIELFRHKQGGATLQCTSLSTVLKSNHFSALSVVCG